jgi:hypothetical protein
MEEGAIRTMARYHPPLLVTSVGWGAMQRGGAASGAEQPRQGPPQSPAHHVRHGTAPIHRIYHGAVAAPPLPPDARLARRSPLAVPPTLRPVRCRRLHPVPSPAPCAGSRCCTPAARRRAATGHAAAAIAVPAATTGPTGRHAAAAGTLSTTARRAAARPVPASAADGLSPAAPRGLSSAARFGPALTRPPCHARPRF